MYTCSCIMDIQQYDPPRKEYPRYDIKPSDSEAPDLGNVE